MSDLDAIKEIEQIIGKKLTSYSSSPYQDIVKCHPRSYFLLNKNKQVTELNLEMCSLTKLEFLKKLPNITKLYLHHNQIIDISILKLLPKLNKLDLSDNQIIDISVLKSLPNLIELDLSKNQIDNILILKYLHNLTHLNVFRNNLSNISNVKALTNLISVELSENKISDISSLQFLPRLKYLDLGLNQITDISVLKYLPSLASLLLHDNKISDIKSLKYLSNLTLLVLYNNQITDISVLNPLYKLTELCLNNNKLKTIPEWLFHLNIPIQLSGNYGNGVFLENNPIEQPPMDIIKQGNEAVRDYFEQSKKENYKDTEIKKTEGKIIIYANEFIMGNKEEHNIDTGDKTMTGETRTIHSTNYIEGNVSGGNIAGRDINIQSKPNMSKEEFLKLLQALKDDLPNSALPADELESINSDIEAVENQVKKEKPSKSIISNKLNGVNGMLDDISETMETVEKGAEVFTKVVDTVKILVSAIATASFFL